eukprot:TRINITY_DN9939_c0_g1_i1.p1 TRINITY_DN9939_c0_g1~~TRINITY_DN9939_c0_g1_i1.p1  ORF type:complete len:189 (+),score=60.19 TRINITY_DN9939_c0_g1_i1:580-1146(+)
MASLYSNPLAQTSHSVSPDIQAFVTLVQKIGTIHIAKSISWEKKKVSFARVKLVNYITDDASVHADTLKAYESKSSAAVQDAWIPLTPSEAGELTSFGSIVYGVGLSSTIASFIGVETQDGELHLTGATTFSAFRQIETFSGLKSLKVDGAADWLEGSLRISLEPLANSPGRLVSLTLNFTVQMKLEF